MSIKITQKYYITCLFLDNKVSSYTECLVEFNKKFEHIKFILSEDNIKKIKNSISGNYKNYTIDELCKSLKIKNKNLIVHIIPIRVNYKNSKNEIEIREQNIIVISEKNMINLLDNKISKQFGIDNTKSLQSL